MQLFHRRSGLIQQLFEFPTAEIAEQNAGGLVRRIRQFSLHLGNGQLDTMSISLPEMRVRTAGVVHELSRGEAEVLALLLEHSPAPLTTVEIAKLLPAKRATIESRIKSLRKKLGPGRLVTRGSFGYELR